MNSLKAKIFLSCGQNKSSDEPVLAEKIASRLRDELGFECYVAVVDNSLSGLKENIFRHLETSEYFLFIDFKREKLGWWKPDHRGSLFTNQELAVASYLNKPGLFFQERGVKPRDGMLSCFHVNSHWFHSRSDLVNLVVSAVRQKLESKEWSNEWKDMLSAEIPSKRLEGIAQIQGTAIIRNYYHLEVVNHHLSKAALNCCVFLDSIEKDGVKQEINPVEIKWAGAQHTMADVVVPPASRRRFDAFVVNMATQSVLEFVTLTDSTEFMPVFVGPATYRITYGIYSSNFPLLRQTFNVTNTGLAKGMSVVKAK